MPEGAFTILTAMLLCYITDRRQLAGSPAGQRQQLLGKIRECATAGIDFIQLREKDLSTRALQELAVEAMEVVPQNGRTRLLINSRMDIALACSAHGLHLPANDLPAGDARSVLVRGGLHHPVIGVSAHSLEEVLYAGSQGADFAVFGPVFQKDRQTAPEGLIRLREASSRSGSMPVLALGGVTMENAAQCMEAGAAGIAAIRLFQENDVRKVVETLRGQRFEI